VLNRASAYVDAGLVQMNNPGTYYYMSTRNNQYSNRSQKGTIVVFPLPAWAVALIVVGSVVGAAAIGVGTVAILGHYAITHPASALGKSFFGVSSLNHSFIDNLP
jgi:hypothetical protein